MLLMEEKIPWNLRVFESIAKDFDAMVVRLARGDKGTCASAACLMFLLADPAERRKFIDFIKLAEGRGESGTILEAAKAVQAELEPMTGPEVPAVLPGGVVPSADLIESSVQALDAVPPAKRSTLRHRHRKGA